ncbi:MAG: hypothetical protein GXP30_14120 [Verrucomicrobia bacterium]|nr:hypothetical protein [Verrucomicrobiota bacterium]
MQFDIATLCDWSQDYNGKMIVAGTFDSLMSKEFPTTLPSCSLALRLSATKAEAGKHKLLIQLQPPEDGEVIQLIESDLEIRFNDEGLPFVTQNIIFPFNGLKLERSGLYVIELLLDDKVLHTIQLAAIEIRDEKDDDATEGSGAGRIEKNVEKKVKEKDKPAKKKKAN